ncbi:EAL domain-containing protein [uncultured Cohaesibacter sp.]|uniref:EAL domain-containing protein n=1 Tax=uncultured Cohaesibacter sp. TaxID=1002546 RepID=UPI0029C99BEA|nr:EAL domain-containing protein [uncultured Cohaesibacter sp.]
MRNRVRSVILLLLGVVLGLVPMFLAHVFMRDYVQSRGERNLQQTAVRSLVNAEEIIQEAVDVFSTLPHYRVPICDKKLQDRFRAMTLRHGELHDVGLIYNGEFMYCSSMQESTRFYPISEAISGMVPHLMYVAVEDGFTGKKGLLVTWVIQEQVSLGAFILADEFNLKSMQTEFGPNYRMSIDLTNDVPVAETSPELKLREKAPFATIEADSIWGGDLIEYQIASERYPVEAKIAVPFASVWQSFEGIMNVIDGFAALTGVFILFFFVRLGMRKPSPYVSIRQGIKQREFIPYYQPIIDIQSGRLAGCEVLVRWRKEDGTVVSPGHFIATAEASGLAVPMTSLLMEQVAEELSDAYARFGHLKVAINLFNRHFDDIEIVTEIERTFGNSGVRFTQLVFEVTERQPLENLDRARAIIERMQRLGVRVALDDAGTGHGGFAYLQKLGMDIIKIDKLFVDSITAESESVPIVDSLCSMAKGMKMVVVAEGVETEEQLTYLRNLGINEAQGYIFSPPLPGSAYLELVEALGGAGSKKVSGGVPSVLGPNNSVKMPRKLIA